MTETREGKKCKKKLRHSEYYSQTYVYDKLYKDSQKGKIFTDLISKILSRENILLAYRNIKKNRGGNTAGTDGKTIKDIAKLQPMFVVKWVRRLVNGSANNNHGYAPRAVRRVDIPKAGDPTKTRPLGIPCIWDRLIQQCIIQVLEPICEAKFSQSSYGFRPDRSTRHAIARTYSLINRNGLHYIIEFDIKGFFDNVDHSKLVKQIWALGIRDKHLIYVLKQILKAPIKMPDGKTFTPDKGTPQGGIISPLLANIVLNELDHWVDQRWSEHPKTELYSRKDYAYKAMKKTSAKEMFIVRYADDFRIFCRTKSQAEAVKYYITKRLKIRLKLDVSPEKTRIVNVKRKYSLFLGFKIKARKKGKKWVTQSHICDKAAKKITSSLKEQVKRIQRPKTTIKQEVILYNSKVMGIHNYYEIATDISQDMRKIGYFLDHVLVNRLKGRLKQTGRKLKDREKKRYGESRMMRYVNDEPLYPIAYAQCKNPMNLQSGLCRYTCEGRKLIHDDLTFSNNHLIEVMMSRPHKGISIEYADNRLSLFSAQYGRCAVTGYEFVHCGEIACHHIKPKSEGGADNYQNLVIICKEVHRLIHATRQTTIQKYLGLLNLEEDEIKKVNQYREKAGLEPIKI